MGNLLHVDSHCCEYVLLVGRVAQDEGHQDEDRDPDDVTVRGSNGAELRCDKCISDFTLDDVDALVLPGGLPGASNLGKSTEVKAIIGEAVQNKLYVAAICAAPLFVIDKMKEFHGKNVCAQLGHQLLDVARDAPQLGKGLVELSKAGLLD